MTPIPVSPPLPESLDVLTDVIRRSPARADARAKITISAVPVRTCYETMSRLVGPRDAVLSYAAYLFAEEANLPSPPTPPLAVEGSHLDADGQTLTLILSRGSYAGA